MFNLLCISLNILYLSRTKQLQILILETTYFKKENKELINDLIGFPIPLLKRVKMGGIGSKRLMIEDVSADFKELMNRVSDINYANIELRPGGILVMINKGLRNFTWVIPYYQLAFYNTDNVSIHAKGKFIKFKKNIKRQENKEFFKKMMDFRNAVEKGKRHDELYQFSN